MDFYGVLDQVLALLRQRGRVSYRALKRQFDLDDAYLDDLKVEIIEVSQCAVDQDGTMLVWTGAAEAMPLPTPLEPMPLSPTQADHGARAASLSPAALRSADAERRQLTVMFCDLVDSTTLASRLDPEDLREVVRAYQTACEEVIQRYGGYIAQYLGDGLLVYFGYPQAHEDDAHRAVRAGLGILDALVALNTRLEPPTRVRLAVRLSIHTGLVVVGEVGGVNRHEQLALGETPNLAARIQGLAAPDALLISAATYRLVQGYFACQDLGTHTLKGVATPMHVYHVVQASVAQSRLDVMGATSLTPLVGREAELTLLMERWVQSQDGLGQVVLLSGEAGIGKSRLVEALRQRLGNEGMTSIVLRCSPYYTNSALSPVIEHLQRLLHFHREDTPEAKLDKLERTLREYRFARDEVVPLFAALLSVPLPEGRYPPLPLSPQEQKRKTAEALVAWLVEAAERQPLLAVWEDLHWADPSTIELLSLIIDQSRTARMLTLLTCRPEFQPSWSPRSHLTHLTLNRFTHPQVELLIAQAMDGKSLPPEVVQQVVAKTDGVPLFVEELLKMVVESGLVREEADRYVLNGPLPPLAIPATLQDSLMARLDRLAPVKDVAQLGAVLGRSFPYDVMQAVSSLDEEALQRGLAQLVDAELLYQRGHPPQAQYLFKHALIQDAAYQSLLKSTRQQYHLRIAQVLAAQFPETAETQPELLAQHYTEAGLAQQATKYWLRAGQRANERSAYVEAIAHCTKGLALLETLPETPEHAQHELMLCLALGTPLVATKGHGAMDVERVFSRARALCAQGGSTAHRFQALAGLFVFYELRGALRIAHELTQELLTMAQHEPVTVFRPRACACGGQTFLYLGDLTSARTTFEQGMAVYDPRRHSPQVLGIWQDSGVTCLSFVALILWLQGYPDQAKATSHNALTLSEQLSHPFTTAFAAFQAASLHRLLRERPQVQEHVEMVRVLETTYGLTQFSAQSTMMQGWALATQGDATEGMAQLREGLDVHRAKGTELGLPSYLTMLAEVYLIQGRIDEGLTVVTEALALVDKNEERWWEAELHRLKGELLVSQVASRESEGEACLQQSLAVARRQEAKSLELRTAMSLARLWQQQGKRAEAHALLAPIYGWFTEGFDTADLQEAKALLEALT